MSKKISVPAGIEGLDLKTVTREVPDDDLPGWGPNATLAVVGKPTPRLDGVEKVTGAGRYTADVQLPGMLYAARLTSPHPHARILSLDTSSAERAPGVKAVHVLEHSIDGAKLKGGAAKSKSAYPVLRYAGQPIAAVAAETEAQAQAAVKKIRVEYEKLVFVAELKEAQQLGAPRVFPGEAVQEETAGGGGGGGGVAQAGNVRGPAVGGQAGAKGQDVDKGFEAADVIVDGEYRTQVQTHSALETHGVVADWGPGGLTVYASTQGTKTVRDELAHVFGLPKSKVRVITQFMGGGFGAKFGAGSAGVLATHLSKKASRPVRLMLDRKEEHLSAGNRPNARMRTRIGAKKDGTLLAIHHVSHGTAGVGTGAGTSGPAQNMYPAQYVRTEDYDVFINAGPGAAFRAPGHPQGCFALEQSIDELAERLAMDPLTLRDRIDGPGGRFIESAARSKERALGAERIGWKRRQAPGASPGPIKRGIGMAQSVWYRFVDRDSACEVRIMQDGSVELRSGVQDIGTGIRTALAQVVAEELGLRPERVTIEIGDTRYPNGPASGGSKTTGSITPPAREAAYRVKQALLQAVAEAEGLSASDLSLADGQVKGAGKAMSFAAACRRLPTEEISARAQRRAEYGDFNDGRPGTGGMGGVQFAEVAVDTETGVITVERVVAAHDCGRPINPLAIESQINGGVIQGISYALYEDRVLDSRYGHMVNANLDLYKIAGAREIPSIEVALIEAYAGSSSTDAGGIGEPATIPTAAAIANAVYNAIGVRIRELPMTPWVVLSALESARAGQVRAKEARP